MTHDDECRPPLAAGECQHEASAAAGGPEVLLTLLHQQDGMPPSVFVTSGHEGVNGTGEAVVTVELRGRQLDMTAAAARALARALQAAADRVTGWQEQDRAAVVALLVGVHGVTAEQAGLMLGAGLVNRARAHELLLLIGWPARTVPGGAA
ncbi:MAG TPA: hypothetical protein VLJ59_08025 [Mycobacteriales bacterium]|nr:hypothetical protein [Mycobacteriales bacterium]